VDENRVGAGQNDGVREFIDMEVKTEMNKVWRLVKTGFRLKVKAEGREQILLEGLDWCREEEHGWGRGG